MLVLLQPVWTCKHAREVHPCTALALDATLPHTLHIIHVCRVSGRLLAIFPLGHHSVLWVARRPV